jgi:SagB-type dehydrogenase family enzyme
MLNNPGKKKEYNVPGEFIYPIEETINLTRPTNFPPINFWDVLDNRKSHRNFRKLSLEEISKVLWSAAKVKEIQGQADGYMLTRRPSASAGARHPIDILIISPALENNQNIYYYNPFDHSLNKLGIEKQVLTEFSHHANSILSIYEGSLVWFLSHPDRTSTKYDNPLSLIWRDAGALIHSFQVACSGLNINSCAIGTLGEPFMSTMFSKFGKTFGAGGIIIG